MANQQRQESVTDEGRLLDETDAANYLWLSPRTLQNFRVRGGGPDFVRLSSRAVRYRLEDLNEFIDDRVHNSTSEYCTDAEELSDDDD